MTEKKFKFGESVYVVLSEDGDYRLIKGKIAGVREYKTASSSVIYAVTTPESVGYYLPSMLYRSVDEFKEEVINHVVE